MEYIEIYGIHKIYNQENHLIQKWMKCLLPLIEAVYGSVVYNSEKFRTLMSIYEGVDK